MGVRVFVPLALGVIAAFALGAERSPAPWAIALCCAGCAAIGVALRGRAGWLMLALAAALLGFAVAGARTFQYPDDSVGRLLGDRMTILSVEGVVLEEPSFDRPSRGELARFVRDSPATRFTLRVRGLRTDEGVRGASGDLWVRVEGVMTDLRAGDSIALRGQGFGIEPPMNPGERDFRPRAHERNMAGRLLVPTPELVERLGRGSRRIAWQTELRERASWWISSLPVGDEARALLSAALLGETEAGYSRVQRSFARTGLAHLLAISGLHLALLAWFAMVLARLVFRGWRAGSVVVALAVVAYLAIVPANPPIVRAAIMTLGFLAASALGRRYDPLNVLAWTACAIVLVRPTDLMSVGFQLSFLAVAGLIALAPRVRDGLLRIVRPGDPDPDRRTRGQRAAHGVCAALGTAIAAWLITAPLVAMHIGIVTPFAVAASVVFAPLFAALLGAGYLTMTVSAIAPPQVVAPFAWATGRLAEWMVALVGVADRAPLGAVRLPPVDWWWAGLATAAMWVVLEKGVRARGAVVGLAIVVGAAAYDGSRAGRLDPDVALRIDTLSVGDGACHALRAGVDVVLWDCGSTWAGVGERDIPDALRALGIWRVRTLIVSHPNMDHYSGVLDAAHRIGLREVLTTRAFLDEAERDPLGPVAYTVGALRARGVGVRAIGAGDAVPLGSTSLRFLWPAAGFASERANDESLVARVEVDTDAGARSLLMLGDIEPAGMEAMLVHSGALRADIVEAPHHGSARPGAIAFVKALEPSVVVQSTGPQRLGDERWDGVKARAAWWTTAADGSVHAEVRRDGMIVSGRSAPGRQTPERATIRPLPRSPDPGDRE